MISAKWICLVLWLGVALQSAMAHDAKDARLIVTGVVIDLKVTNEDAPTMSAAPWSNQRGVGHVVRTFHATGAVSASKSTVLPVGSKVAVVLTEDTNYSDSEGEYVAVGEIQGYITVTVNSDVLEAKIPPTTIGTSGDKLGTGPTAFYPLVANGRISITSATSSLSVLQNAQLAVKFDTVSPTTGKLRMQGFGP